MAYVIRIRFPFDPVDDYVRHDQEIAATAQFSTSGKPNVLALARRLGVSAQTVHRWRNHGVSHHQADRIATALDLHPNILWPDFHADIEEDLVCT